MQSGPLLVGRLRSGLHTFFGAARAAAPGRHTEYTGPCSAGRLLTRMHQCGLVAGEQAAAAACVLCVCGPRTGGTGLDARSAGGSVLSRRAARIRVALRCRAHIGCPGREVAVVLAKYV